MFPEVGGSFALLAYVAVEARPRPRRLAALGTAAALAAVLAHGLWTLSRPVPEKGRIRVGLVQASVLQDDKWAPQKAWANIDRHLDLTRLAVARGVGEYGSVVFVSGNMPFKTEIAPILIVARLEEFAYSEATAIAAQSRSSSQKAPT